jgi:heptosyltransferase-2
VLRDAAVVLSHDTGPMHLARLVRAPLVALFGPTSPSEFILEDARTVVLWGGRHLACRPCYDGRDFAECRDNVCMQSIGVDDALDAVEQVIARGREVAA